MLDETYFNINYAQQDKFKGKVKKLITYIDDLTYDDRPQYSSIVKIFGKLQKIS